VEYFGYIQEGVFCYEAENTETSLVLSLFGHLQHDNLFVKF
jgi:hypothetical protein